MKTNSLKPTRALLTPLFTASLLLLVLNDHVLKGAGVLPGWLTGKLSDFAGLIVAPVVLAVALRIRTKIGFARCMAAAALFLALLQGSPWFTSLWVNTLSKIGIPWHNTADPTDLIALLAFIPAWKYLLPAMAQHAANSVQRRVPEALIWLSASFFLMATSRPKPYCEPLWSEAESVDIDEPPAYPSDMSGRELLDRLERMQPLAFDYFSEPNCWSAAAIPPTKLFLAVNVASAQAFHSTLGFVEGSDEECFEDSQKTAVRVEATVTLSSEDGQMLAVGMVLFDQDDDVDQRIYKRESEGMTPAEYNYVTLAGVLDLLEQPGELLGLEPTDIVTEMELHLLLTPDLARGEVEWINRRQGGNAGDQHRTCAVGQIRGRMPDE